MKQPAHRARDEAVFENASQTAAEREEFVNVVHPRLEKARPV